MFFDNLRIACLQIKFVTFYLKGLFIFQIIQGVIFFYLFFLSLKQICVKHIFLKSLFMKVQTWNDTLRVANVSREMNHKNEVTVSVN